MGLNCLTKDYGLCHSYGICILQHCSIYQLGFFGTRPDQVTLVTLGVIVVTEDTDFHKLAVCSGVTLSSNLLLGGMILL